jgi:hypothetical protein
MMARTLWTQELWKEYLPVAAIGWCCPFERKKGTNKCLSSSQWYRRNERERTTVYIVMVDGVRLLSWWTPAALCQFQEEPIITYIMLFHNTTDTRMAARHGFCRKPIKDSC